MAVRRCHYCGRELEDGKAVLDWEATGDRTFGIKYLCEIHSEVKASSVRMARFVLGIMCLLGIIYGLVKGVEWLYAGCFGIAFVGLPIMPNIVDSVLKRSHKAARS